jgi:hypothetical protein
MWLQSIQQAWALVVCIDTEEMLFGKCLLLLLLLLLLAVFSDPQQYLLTFKQAYAKALDMDPSAIRVGSLACDGRTVKAPAGGSAAAAPRAGAAPAAASVPAITPSVTWAPANPPTRKRSLLDVDEGAEEASNARHLMAVKQAPKKPAVLTTEFTVPAPADATERAELAATVMEMSPSILETPMTEFFGRPVQVAPAVEQPTTPPKAPAAKPKPAAVPKPAPSPKPAAPKPPKKTPLPSPSPSPLPLPKPALPAPPAEEAVPETPIEAPPQSMVEATNGISPTPQRSPFPAGSHTFPQRPTSDEPAPSPRPATTLAHTPPPSPSPAPQAPQRPGNTWTLLPIFRPTGQQQQQTPQAQPARPRWPFGQQKPHPPAPPGLPPAPPGLPPAPPMPLPDATGPEEATPVLVTLTPSPSPRLGAYPAPPSPPQTFSWPAAPACKGKPNGHTATPDAEGRLW